MSTMTMEGAFRSESGALCDFGTLRFTGSCIGTLAGSDLAEQLQLGRRVPEKRWNKVVQVQLGHLDTVDGCEILHQLIDGLSFYPIISRLSTILDWWFIGFRWPIHRSYGGTFVGEHQI
jgi:hypothetical protein